MKTILFQGDSITDALRHREEGIEGYRGCGYPTMVSGRLGAEYPDEYIFLNRGISGNRSADLYARVRKDIINLKPDYLSILLGVNDIWHELDIGNGVSAERFYDLMKMTIEDVKAALPEIKIILMGAFVTPGTATNKNLDIFVPETKKRADALEKLAKEYSIPFISLQDVFDEAMKKGSPENWTIDGVHPTAAGHELIAREWIKVFEEIK